MENQTNINERFNNLQNKKWPWIVSVIIVVGILIYFVVDDGGSLLNNWSSITEFQNNNTNQANQSNPIIPVVGNEDVDALLNELNLEESRTSQALNDTSIDVMSDN